MFIAPRFEHVGMLCVVPPTKYSPLTVNTFVVVATPHTVVTVLVIVAVPIATPVTTPELLIRQIVVSELDHAPAPGVLERVVVDPAPTTEDPLIGLAAGSARTVVP